MVADREGRSHEERVSEERRAAQQDAPAGRHRSLSALFCWYECALEIDSEGRRMLPAADRIRLVEYLLASLDRPDPDIDRIWWTKVSDASMRISEATQCHETQRMCWPST
ncbi:MAG TPA: addiction module protein [Xanthobacteraceae bacterium]|jgi:hypothetical protein